MGSTQGREWDSRLGLIPPEVVLYFVSGLFVLTGVIAMANVGFDIPLYAVLFESFMYVGLALVIPAGTYYLQRSELPRETLWSVVVGYFVGILFVTVLLLWATLGDLLAGQSLVSLRDDFVFFGNLGGIFGFVAGVSRARNTYNRRLRKQLETSNELVESAKEALWMFSPDWSEILYINSVYEDLFGQPTEALEADSLAFMETIHPDDRALARRKMERLSAGESVDFEMRVNAREEFDRWVWVQGQPVYKNGKLHAIAGFARDITRTKQRQRRFEAIFNQTYQFTGLLEPDGTLIEINDTALSFVGANREDVIGTHLSETPWFEFDESTKEMARESVETARNGGFYRGELTISGRDDERIAVDYSVRPITDESGEVVLMVPEGRDITDRKEHESQLVTLHETTRRLFRADSESEAAEITTQAARDVIGLPVNTLLLADERGEVLRPVRSTTEAEELLESIPDISPGEGLAGKAYEANEPQVYDNVAAEPDRFNPETSIRSELLLPLGDRGVLVAGSTEVGAFDHRQVSLGKLLASNAEAALDRIETQRDLRQRQQKLERQNERLEEFAGVVSHDLRNPLTVARGSLRFAQQKGDCEEMQNAMDALDRMGTLIDDLLALARAGEVVDELQPVDLETLAKSCLHAVETDDATVEFDIDMVVRGDDGRLGQLFENLFRNSLEHGGEDVTIRVDELDDEPGFYVADDGPGIPEENREDVFEAGMTTSPEGSGFGLSIVREIADAHGWETRITDGIDGGARFEFAGVDQEVEPAQMA